jgi:hypothetical protein
MLVRDYVDNLILSTDGPWPPPALVSKLVEEDRIAARWPSTLTASVAKRLGHYTPPQSIMGIARGHRAGTVGHRNSDAVA